MIFATPSRDASSFSSVMSIAAKPDFEERVRESKRIKSKALQALGFSEEDKVGTFQPHDDALIVALHIRGYDVKRVLVDWEAGLKLCTLTYIRG